MWANTKEEAVLKMGERVDALVKEHELDEEKVFVNRGGERTCIFKQSLGFVYNGGLTQQQTLSIVSVPHHSDITENIDHLTTKDVGGGEEEEPTFNKIIGGDPILD
jgi:hypothetical protein